MFIDKDSVIINGISIGQYITEAEFGYNKLWSSSSGRSLSGAMTGSLIGIFPKLVLQFRPLTRQELNIIAPILDSSGQRVSYYDPNKNRTVTMTTYTGDWKITNRNLNQNEGFSCSFIATKRRS